MLGSLRFGSSHSESFPVRSGAQHVKTITSQSPARLKVSEHHQNTFLASQSHFRNVFCSCSVTSQDQFRVVIPLGGGTQQC